MTSPDPPAGVFAVKVTVRVAPAARVPTGQVTVPAATVQPSGLAANVRPAGSGSVIVAPVACDGPLFSTVNA